MNVKNKHVSTGRKKMVKVIGDNLQIGTNSIIMVDEKVALLQNRSRNYCGCQCT